MPALPDARRLDALLDDAAARTPEKTFVVAGDVRASYADVAHAAHAISTALRARGVERGDRVVVCMENGVPAVATLFAIWRAGAVAVLVHASTKPDKLARIIADADALCLVTTSRTVTSSAPVTLDIDALTAIVSGDDSDDDDAPVDVATDELALLLYTSGSTGAPKGVMHSHASLLSATRSIVTYLENDADDVVLQVLPLSFGYGLTQLLTMASVGGTLILEKSFAFPQKALQRIAAERVTGLAVVPTVATLFLQNGMREGGAHDLSSLRYVTNAGAGMPVALVRRMRAALPSVKLFLMYGQTECIRGSYLAPSDVDRRPDAVGRGMPNADVWLVDDDGAPVERGVGELVIRGAHVMRGYWRNDAATALKLRAGRHDGERVLFTGDLFERDDEGLLKFVARKDDIIKTRGEKVSPREVEEALLTVDGIRDAAVAGVPDDVLGEAVIAFVVAERVDERVDERVNERAVLRACKERLDDYAVPKRVVFVDALPKSENGKIDKRALVDTDTRAPATTTHADKDTDKETTVWP